MNPITTIRAGDILTRPKALGLVTHVGVAVAPDLILQNTPDKGEHLATLQEFSAGKPVTVHRTGVDPSIITARAQEVLANPQKYNLIENNCEHTTTKVVHGIARSAQIFFWCMIALVGLVFLFMALMPRKRRA